MNYNPLRQFGFALIGLWLPLCHAQSMADLEYITENYPPYNYLEGKLLKGEAVDLLLAATALMGSPVKRSDILIQPWARGFRNTLEGPNRVLFSTTRTPARERLFKWAGPIGSNHVVLIAKKQRHIAIERIENLERYRIGAVRDDVGELFLRDLHLESSIITLGVQPDSIAKMLQSGRIDLWAYGESSANNTLLKIGANPDQYEVVWVLKTLDLYFAFSRDVDSELVQQFQQAIDTVKGQPTHKPDQPQSEDSQLYGPVNSPWQ